MTSRFRPTTIALACAAACAAFTALPAAAQQAADTSVQTGDGKPLSSKPEEAAQQVIVTGIRASAAKSLAIKREASANVDVISAIDVGKMPDKNLADSLQRLPGVQVRTDYDEAEKVALRGTNPDLALILFNGHTVSGGDWYVSDQTSSSRSTSLSLMPSSVLNSATVYKTSQANIADGGLAGTINVTTRKPLLEPKNLGGVVSLGAVYSDLPGKWGPQANGSVNWKNEANTFGLIAQAFSEKRYIRRDSASRFAYGSNSGWDVINTSTMKGITDASLAGTGFKAADLNGVRLPGSMSTEFVEGVRDRTGGMLSLQFRPMKDLDIGVTTFQSKMNADNFGRLTSGAIYGLLAGQIDPVSGKKNDPTVFAQLRNPVVVEETTIYGDKLRVLKSADILLPAGSAPHVVGHSEGFFRSGAKASSGFTDFDATWRVNDDLKFKALFSDTRGEGMTDMDRGVTYTRYGQGISYAIKGLNEVPDFRYIGAGENRPGLNADGSGYMLSSRSAVTRYLTIDKEQSLAIDGEYALNRAGMTTIEFGVRGADHRRDHRRSNPPLLSSALLAPDPSLAVSYPSDFGSGLGGGNWDRTGFYFPREVLRSFFDTQVNYNVPDEFQRKVAAEIEMREKQTAGYAMLNFELWDGKLSGNFGVRQVQTQVKAQIAMPVSATICPHIKPGDPVVPCAAFPGAINTASDGIGIYDGTNFNPKAGTVYYKQAREATFNHTLPSLNLRMELAPKLLARFGASQTIGRQNYNLYGAGYTGQTCNASGCTVNGPNFELKPMTADNLDLSLGWFYAKDALIQVNVFASKIKGYPKTGVGTSTVDLIDPTDNQVKTYRVNTSAQQGAKIQGVELLWEQPLGGGFGINANVSLADSKVDDGRPMVGASDKSANLGLYYERPGFSARLVYNYRSEYVSSTTAPAATANSQGMSTINGVLMPTAPTIAAPVSNLALSLNFDLGPVQLAFNATNLTNPVRATYRYSTAEQQKLDVSGRQYYLEARYKF